MKLAAAAAAALAALCADPLWAGPASAELAPGNHRVALQHGGRPRSYDRALRIIEISSQETAVLAPRFYDMRT